jgi:hypothetical protein
MACSLTNFCPALALVMLLLTLPGAQGPRDILGRWHGHSICVKAPWNTACNDEEVFYDFVAAGPDSNRILLHAAKLVAGHAEPMGDLALVYTAEPRSWAGEFSNARVHIRWSYRLRGDSLEGEVVFLPTLQVARHVLAWRDTVVP